MFDKASNTKKQGSIGVGHAISWALQQGYTVSIPLNDSQDYDLIFDINGHLKKIQVKTSRYSRHSNSYVITLRHSGGNRSRNTSTPFVPSSVDFLFILTENGDKYFIPTNVITHINAITVGNKWLEYKL